VSDASFRNDRLSPRQETIRRFFDGLADERGKWIEKNAYFYEADRAYMRFLIPEGMSVLEVGCGNGQLLAALRPSRGIGIDLSPAMLAVARRKHPDLEFICGNIEDPKFCATIAGEFDFVVLSDTVGYLDDCQAVLANLRPLLARHGRLVVAYYGRWWQPLLTIAEKLRLKMPHLPQNWLTTDDLKNLFELSDLDMCRREWRQLIPRRLLGIGPFINRFIAPLPGIRRLSLRNYLVGRALPERRRPARDVSATIVIPCRNEFGNIETAIRRMPRFSSDMELIFVEGHSSDGTHEECLRVRDAYPSWDIKVLQQTARGKGDAVRTGFSAARGEILMILDADLSIAPEMLPKFYEALILDRSEFVNGTRLVYAMEKGAMRPLNFVANRAFALIFNYLLNVRLSDTLCGTKALWRHDYERIAAGRGYFGEFDPFGDFDLLFGAAKHSLKIVEIPIRYASRTYGETQISRFSDGWLLARMVLVAWRKLKAL